MKDTEDSFARVLRAATFAAERHRDQRRKGAEASPYINHPLAVAGLIAVQCDNVDPTVLIAALLHDTIEDTDTSLAEIREAFGAAVADIVAEVTDDKSLPKAERKQLQIEHAPHLSDRAKLVKLADKICNLRDIDTSPPSDWPLERQQEYFDWAKQVVDQIRGTHAGLEELFDTAYSKRPNASGEKRSRLGFTKEQWAALPLEERARLNGWTPQEQAQADEFSQKIGQSMVDALNYNVRNNR